MNAALRRELEAALGAGVTRATPLSGGDINDAFRVELATGRVVFVKANGHAPPAMFAEEARGLAWLAEAHALRVPEVIASSGAGPVAYLVLEYLHPGPRVTDFDERLGRGLAALHRHGAPAFGFTSDNFIGRLPQANGPLPRWSDFYRERRLSAELRRAVDSGAASPRMRAGFDRLFAALDERVGLPEPPARLHGDLWGGNLHIDDRGEPCLVDPAVYGGHREVDLAMMRLFGGFGERTFDAYEEAYPLAPGHEERVTLYQLYPLMVHVNLFGGSYVGAVERALDRLA